MNTLHHALKLAMTGTLAGAMLLTAGCDTMNMPWSNSKSTASNAQLSGQSETPPNPSAATGDSSIRVASDKSVSGTITYNGMSATAAHIHEGAPGSSGPVIVPLVKASDRTFTVPPGTRLTDAQYASYQAGNLYVNVHSANFPDGEIRAQLKPQ